MAANKRTFTVEINDTRKGTGLKDTAGEVDSLKSSLDKAGGAADNFDNKLSVGDRVKSYSDGLNRAGESMRQLGAKSTAFVSLPLLAAFGSAQQASSNLGEAQNATNQVFGQASDVISRVGETSAETMGLSERAFREAVTPMGAMLQNLGFSQAEAADSSVALSQRAADMASVFNTDVGTALEAINAGLRGETDPLEQFGVGMSAAAVEAKAMEMGLGATASELTDNEKAQARLALLMEQTNGIAGDFAATSGEAANKQRILTAEAEDAAAKFGNNLQPVMDRVLGIVGGLLDKFNNLSPGMQQVITYVGLAAIAFGPLVSIVGTLSTVMGFLAANPIVLVIAAIAAFVVGLIWAYNNVGWFRDLVDGAFKLIKNVISGVFNWVKGNWPLLLAILTGPIGLAVFFITKHWNTIKETFGRVMGWIGDRAAGARDWIVGVFRGLIDWFRGMPGSIANAASGMFQGIADAFKSAINWVIDKWNNFEISWGGFNPPGPGSIPGFTIDTPNIPRLAEGGIVPATPGGRMAILGEGGEDEAVIPLSRGFGAGGGGTVVNLDMRGAVIASDRQFEDMVVKAFRRASGKGVPLTLQGRTI